MGNVQKTRWGILACGRIARKFADDLKHVEGAELVAVASRDLERAKVFAESFPEFYKRKSLNSNLLKCLD